MDDFLRKLEMIERVLDERKPAQWIKVVFKKNSNQLKMTEFVPGTLAGLQYLVALAEEGCIAFVDGMTIEFIKAQAKARKWPCEENRTIFFVPSGNVSADVFMPLALRVAEFELHNPQMDIGSIEYLLRQSKLEDRIIITFKLGDEGLGRDLPQPIRLGCERFLAMNGQTFVLVRSDAEEDLRIATEHGYWTDDDERTVVIRILDGFNAHVFVSQCGEAIESVDNPFQESRI